ncbi:hypothetical protein PMIN06_011007 [Paraphaeosphaeria minitans]
MPSSPLPVSAYDALGLSEETVRIATTPRRSPPTVASPNLLQDAQEPEQRLAMDDTAIVLYAELLLHIRTVTLFASLRTESTRETKARLESNGRAVTVTHEGTSATIKLPIQVQGGGDAALSLPASPPSKDLTLRLQIEEKEGSNMLGTLLSEDRKANIAPWDGASLSKAADVTIHCKSCEKVIVPADAVREWRDLPNENWAEMMDFWHCHKPDEHHLHDHANEEAFGNKGYAASNRLQAAKGIGFVDLASFLLDEEECVRIQTSPTAIHCTHCTSLLGAPDPSASGHRIWKWCVGVSTSTPQSQSQSQSQTLKPRSFPPQHWIAARLLHLIENQNVRRFHVHPPLSPSPSPSPSPPGGAEPQSHPVPSLLCWVFTPDLIVSSSLDARGPTRVMKVFWKRQTWSPLAPGEAEKVDEEDVEVVGEVFAALGRALVESQGGMPGSARRWGGWEVGLLERFDGLHVQAATAGIDGDGGGDEDRGGIGTGTGEGVYDGHAELDG